ncbi:hypothetical protein SY2F82_42000 [Streptomyces sp. Y2F8-2]|nr:hypothetical protein SY2F82_42000 [Streptomyces sp. Y2F8-2]
MLEARAGLTMVALGVLPGGGEGAAPLQQRGMGGRSRSRSKGGVAGARPVHLLIALIVHPFVQEHFRTAVLTGTGVDHAVPTKLLRFNSLLKAAALPLRSVEALHLAAEPY